MIAAAKGCQPERVSDGAKPHELALSDLEDHAVERGPREVEIRSRRAVQLHPALGDQPARLAGREPEHLADDGGQVDGVPGGSSASGDLIRRATLPHDAREVRLGLAAPPRLRASGGR